MRTWITAFLIFGLAFQAGSSFAASVCLQDDLGGIWELNGGKVDKRTYSARYIIPASCEVPGYATAVTYGSGIALSLANTQDTTGNCNAVLWFISADTDFNGSGGYDDLGNGSVDGSVTLTRVDCSVLSQPSDKEKVSKNPVLSKKEGGSNE